MEERYERLVAALKSPQAYAAEGVAADASIEVVETHVSHLFMTADTVYKIKKPVDLGFINLTTLARRKANCEGELRLNRRLSPDVYVRVLPVADRDGRLFVGGDGDIVEYAVKMRRLPEDRMLDALVGDEARDAVSYRDVERIADYIARFHKEAERSEEITREGGFDTIARLATDNFAQMKGFVGSLFPVGAMALVEAYSRKFLADRERIFREREEQGRIVDGHGDLHAAHICLQDDISVIDCLEFSRDYRYGDTALDLAFLAMDLDHFGREDLALALVERYMATAHDSGVREVLTFYKCYRAMVRAKVAAIRFETASATDSEGRAVAEREALEYFGLATTYAASALPRAALLVVMGLPGVGKSTLAGALAGSATVVSSDFARKRRVGLAPNEHSYVPYGTGIYSAESDQQTYRSIIQMALGELLESGTGYQVLDASFRDPVYRELLAREANAAAVDVWLIEATASPDVVHRRIAARVSAGDDVSDATWGIYERARADWVTVSDTFGSWHLVVDTDRPVEETVAEVYDTLLTDALARGPADGWATWAARAELKKRKRRP